MICNLVTDLDDTGAARDSRSLRSRYNLNLRTEFDSLVPDNRKLERSVISNILKQNFKAAHLEKVRLEETMMNSFEYAGGAELRI